MFDFRRESPYPMVPVDEAQRIIAANTSPLAVETIGSLDAEGRVLAEDVHAPEAIPDVPKATVDGYAVRADDGQAERCILTEVLTAGAASEHTLEAGTAVRIMTGAHLPNGADAVVMVEQTDEQDGMLWVEQPVRYGDNIRCVGDDVAQGECVVPQGMVLGAAEIGLLAMLGINRVSVYRRPCVAVLATGDELVEPYAPREAGKVRDSNRYALLAAVREAGCEAVSLGMVRDDVQKQRLALLDGIEQADMLITSGGVSMGTRDLIKPLLAKLGTVHFGRVLFKPGKPTTFATVQEKLVFGLPGFPASSLVAFEVFVRPALRRLQGDAHPHRPRVRVTLDEAIQPSQHRPEYQRVTLRWQGSRLVARSTGPQTSSRLLSLRSANGLLIVPAGERTYQAGDTLEALLIGRVLNEEDTA
jgi:molybdopterin molybdotransferase